MYAKPFRQGHKNDFRDAPAGYRGHRPTTRRVPSKTNKRIDLQALHRVCSRLISERTAAINQIRGFLLEGGIVVQQGQRFLRQSLPGILAKRTDVLSLHLIRIIAGLAPRADDWRRLDERVKPVSDEIETVVKSDDNCRRMTTVLGVGPIICNAMIAAIGGGLHLREVGIFQHGPASFPSKYRSATGQSPGASPNEATVTCTCSSCKQIVSSCCDGARCGVALAFGEIVPVRMRQRANMRRNWSGACRARHRSGRRRGCRRSRRHEWRASARTAQYGARWP